MCFASVGGILDDLRRVFMVHHTDLSSLIWACAKPKFHRQVENCFEIKCIALWNERTKRTIASGGSLVGTAAALSKLEPQVAVFFFLGSHDEHTRIHMRSSPLHGSCDA